MEAIFNKSRAISRTYQVSSALLIVYIVWGTTYLANNIAMQTLPPLLMNGTRFVAAGVIMLTFARRLGVAWPTPAQWRNSALIGTLMTFAAMGMMVLAQRLGIGSGLMATVVTSMPMWLALWTRMGGERVPATSWVGLALGVAGALVLSMENDFSATWLGSLCAFGAPLFWSMGSYASRKLSLPTPTMASGAQWLIGGALGLVVSLVFEPEAARFQLTSVSMTSALAWLYLLVLGTLVTLNAYLWLLQNTSAAVAGSYSFVNPVVALCVGVLLGGESLNGWVYLAMPLILLALGLILYGEAAVRYCRVWISCHG